MEVIGTHMSTRRLCVCVCTSGDLTGPLQLGVAVEGRGVEGPGREVMQQEEEQKVEAATQRLGDRYKNNIPLNKRVFIPFFSLTQRIGTGECPHAPTNC